MPDAFDLEQARVYLKAFDFRALFLRSLHWNAPPTPTRPLTILVDGVTHQAHPIAQQASITVYEIVVEESILHTATARAAIAKELRGQAFEALIVFRDTENRGCVWNWLKREGKKTAPREHPYFRWQTGDLFLQKISRLFVDLAELDDEGNAHFRDILGKIEAALDTQPVTKRFFAAFQSQYTALLGSISGIRAEQDRRWFTSLLLNRLMFVAFLEARGFLQDDRAFLRRHLDVSLLQGKDRYYRDFLQPLFFEAFATPNTKERSARAQKYFAQIRYLNGGLFVKHRLERDYEKTLRVPDRAIDDVLRFFSGWTWTLDDTVGGRDDTINPDVLGHIFERYNNARQKEDGAYYTPPDITTYLAERTIPPALLARLGGGFTDLPDLYARCDTPTAERLLTEILPTFRVIDPACGSGAFLLAAFRTLQEIYAFLLDLALHAPEGPLHSWAKELVKRRESAPAAINEQIVTQNLYGVELNQEAVEVARLRMFLELVAPVRNMAQLQPLPNLEYNIMQGNALIGFREQPDAFESLRRQQPLFGTIDYRSILDRKDEALIALYKTESHRRLKKHTTKARIERTRERARRKLDALLVREFHRLKIKVEEQRWDPAKKKTVTSEKRAVRLADVQALTPFHWDYEFRDVFHAGGFDVVLTNPPWEVIQTDEKEFFSRYDPSIKKNKLTKKEWDRMMPRFLENADVRTAWEKYATGYTFQSPYFKASSSALRPETPNGRTIPTKNDSYKVFIARCHSLLRDKGGCGLVVPSGIYTDLGAKGLREMLFAETTITGLFGMNNRKRVFDGVVSQMKFVILTYQKAGQTLSIPTAFARTNTADIRDFPSRGAMDYPLSLVKKLSPDSLSLVELKNEMDLSILKKAARFPLLGETRDDGWNLSLTQEFNMTTDAHLFRTQEQLEKDGWLRNGYVYHRKGQRCLPLFEGKMIHQYRSDFAPPKYWIEEREGRKALLGKKVEDIGQVLDYQGHRLGFRDVARNTDERTMIATVLPPGVFAGNTLAVSRTLSEPAAVLLTSLLDSHVIDYLLRLRVTAHCNFFYVYGTPCPWLGTEDMRGVASVLTGLASTLTSVTSAFRALASGSDLGDSHAQAITAKEHLCLRATIDAFVAHLYGITAEEYEYVLSTFPLVAESERKVMSAMFAALPLKADTRGELMALDLPKAEKAAREDGNVQAALDAAIEAGVTERTAKNNGHREMKKAA